MHTATHTIYSLKQLFWYLENRDLSRLLRITPFFPSFYSAGCYLILIGCLSRILWFLLIQGAGTEFPFSCQAGSKQQEYKAFPFSPTSPAFTMAGFPVIHSRQHSTRKNTQRRSQTLSHTHTEKQRCLFSSNSIKMINIFILKKTWKQKAEKLFMTRGY